MRIGLLSTSYPRDPADGAGRFVAELAGWLAGQGDMVEVLAPHPAADPTPGVEVRPLRYALRPALLYGAGAPDNLSTSPRAWLQAPAFCGRLALECMRRAPRWDVVISHWLLPCGAVAARCAPRTPHLAVAHSSDVHLLRRLPAPAGRAALRLIARPRTALVLTTETLRPPLLRLARTPSTRRLVEQALVVRMGIPAPAAVPNAEVEALRRRHDLLGRTVVLFIGRLVPVKGLELLLRACAGVEGLTPVIVGDGPLRTELEELAQQLGVDARFCGALGGTDKAAWLAAADLFALPSIVLPDGRTDAAPVVLLEAMAVGLPVVTTWVGGNAELIEHDQTGLLVSPGEVEPLRAALTALASDAELRRRLGRAGQQVAANHSWDVVGSRLIDCLQRSTCSHD
jgi:glycosyltransferase involved in cell wall biosynthesis